MIVDTHCHASARWYEPVDTLLFNMDRCGVEKAVLVQLLGSHDSMDMIAARDAHPDRFAFVGAIDPDAANAVRLVETARETGAVGLRMRAHWRSSDDDPLALWRAVETSGLCVSMAGTIASFTDGKLEEIARACPNLVIVLEHLGGLARPDAGDRTTSLPPLRALAVHPNIFVKFTGLGQVAPRLPDVDATMPPLDLTDVPSLFASIMEAFGAQRMMWGSDFPPVAAREGYAHALHWCRALFRQYWADSVEACFGGTARKIFSL